MGLKEEKLNIRQQYFALRKGLSPAQAHLVSLEISNQFFKHFEFQGKRISCFLTIPHQHEVDTSYIIKILASQNEIFAPVSDFNSNTMQHWQLLPEDPLPANYYGIPEPHLRVAEARPKRIDVVIVPLLICDLDGYRLGYGKGFYDRFLSECRADVLKIGLNYFEPVSKIPAEDTDIPLDFLITPSNCHAFKR